MSTLFLDAVANLGQMLLVALSRVARPAPAPIVIVDPVRLWSAQQEHYWDRTDW
jgi:hypothetical protein